MTTAQYSSDTNDFIVQTGVVAKHDRFWDKFSQGAWESDTFKAIDSHTDGKTLAIDCGAWIGPTALYMSQRVGLCLAFEPDPMAFATLSQNHELNAEAPWFERLRIFNEAIHSSGAPIQIGGEGGDSMTSVLNSTNGKNSWTVKTRRLQDVLTEYRGSYKKVFVKIDVEGAEYDILPSIADILADKKVSFLIAFHHRWMKLATVEKHAKPEQATAEIIATLRRVVDALPWGRNIRTLDGQVLDRKTAEQAADAGKGFAAELIID